MKVVLSGGLGFIGFALRNGLLEEGHSVVVLTRNQKKVNGDSGNPLLSFVVWNGKSSGAWEQQVAESDVIINLCGENIGKGLWTKERKLQFRTSRTDPANAIIQAIKKAKKKPALLMNASAVGYYGNVEEEDVAENYPKGTGFLADLVAEWEMTASAAQQLGVRVVFMRMGIVLGKHGGMLPRIMAPFRAYLGSVLGSGLQWFPWITIRDAVGAHLHVINHPEIVGAVNVVSPHLVTMAEFCTTLGKALKKPSSLRVPERTVRFVLGEKADLLLKGQRAIPRKLEQSGYHFKHALLEEALSDVLRMKK
jgi:hypothetical protein